MGTSLSKYEGQYPAEAAPRLQEAQAVRPMEEEPGRTWNPFEANFRINFPDFESAMREIGREYGSNDLDLLAQLSPVDFSLQQPQSLARDSDDEETDYIMQRRYQQWFDALKAEKRETVSDCQWQAAKAPIGLD